MLPPQGGWPLPTLLHAAAPFTYLRMATFAAPPPPPHHPHRRSGYQAQISLFMAPLNYTLGDYTQWNDANVLSSQQVAWVRIETYNGITFTWGSFWSTANGGSSSSFGSNSQLTQQVMRGEGVLPGVAAGVDMSPLPCPARMHPSLPPPAARRAC